jgi:hypothetical protein
VDGITRSNVEGRRLQHDLSLSYRATPSLRIDGGASFDDRHSVEYTNENADATSGRNRARTELLGHESNPLTSSRRDCAASERDKIAPALD